MAGHLMAALNFPQGGRAAAALLSGVRAAGVEYAALKFVGADGELSLQGGVAALLGQVGHRGKQRLGIGVQRLGKEGAGAMRRNLHRQGWKKYIATARDLCYK